MLFIGIGFYHVFYTQLSTLKLVGQLTIRGIDKLGLNPSVGTCCTAKVRIISMPVYFCNFSTNFIAVGYVSLLNMKIVGQHPWPFIQRVSPV